MAKEFSKQEIAEILKKTRAGAGYTQVTASEAIGRKRQTLSSWETGQSQPDANTLFELFELYGASVDEAFGFKKEETLDEQLKDVLYALSGDRHELTDEEKQDIIDTYNFVKNKKQKQ